MWKGWERSNSLAGDEGQEREEAGTFDGRGQLALVTSADARATMT